MAVKNTKTKIFQVEYDKICAVLKDPDFGKCIDANFIEQAILPDCVEFRYVRKTNVVKYGRNYFVKVKAVDANTTSVSVTTQSRKVTVLFDIKWEQEVNRIYELMVMLLRRSSET